MRHQMQNKTIHFRASEVLVSKLEERAHAEGMSVSEYLRDLARRDVREAAQVAKDFSGKVAALLAGTCETRDPDFGDVIAIDVAPAPIITPIAEPIVQVVHVAPPPPAPLDEEEDWGWEVFNWSIRAIAAHYGLTEEAVWDVVWDLEAEFCEREGMPWFGRVLQSPEGVACLSVRVAMELTGMDADELPAPFLPAMH